MMKIAFLCMHKEPERRSDMSSVVLEMMHGNRGAEIESQYELYGEYMFNSIGRRTVVGLSSFIRIR